MGLGTGVYVLGRCLRRSCLLNEMIARNKREDGKKEEELPITIGLALCCSTTVDGGLLWELMSLLER